MALKEIKTRIQSVKSTQKITSAMKMVSSSKLRKAQKLIDSFLPYEKRLNDLLQNFLGAEEADTELSLAEVRDIKRVALVAISSNSSLCGSFNANVSKRVLETAKMYESLGKDNILIYPIGKKITKALSKTNYKIEDISDEMSELPTYESAKALADELIEKFLKKEIDKVELIYHHFKNRGSQVLITETLLPLELKSVEKKDSLELNYIIEPDKDTILESLLPKVLRTKVYAILLDSNASEHAARMVAMQIATENADDLLQELSLQYNKSRQQAITNELLDIIGGSVQ